ncbi:MAG: polyphosphate kinase [Chloroflexota bacterium]
MPEAPEISLRHVVSRELSALAFNARVLHEAQDARTPLLDRFKFLGIIASNIDEFFGVRVSGIREQIDAGVHAASADGRTPTEQMEAIQESAALLMEAAQGTWSELKVELATRGLSIVSWNSLDHTTQAQLSTRFRQEIFPVLTPLAIDPGHPFPYVSSLSLSLAVQLRDPERGERFFARVKVPQILARLVQIGDGRAILLEDLIRVHLDQLFVGHELIGAHAFRITRDADIEVEEGEADDLLAAIEEELRQRRFGKVVRVEIEAAAPKEVRELLLAGFELRPDALSDVDGVLDLTVCGEIAALPMPDLRSPVWQPVTPQRITTSPRASDGGTDLFQVVRGGDLFMHYPYESFDASAERLFQQAATDPDVLSIRSTLYRTGANSTIPGHLIQAARAGKEVVVLVELKARFDEAANIEWARRLEEAGAHVIYGMSGLKTHCKATLIARREAGEIRRYVHLSTGNYNPRTARLYTDLSLFSVDPALGADLSALFNYLTGLSKHADYQRLLVAPTRLRDALRERIAAAVEDAARGGSPYIAAKVNALVDTEMIHLLDDAASRGVRIDLIVRGMCGLIPDPERHSGRLHIRSVIGEFLEHSRLYHFNIADRVEWYAGSADLMDRNLDRRVEVLFPLLDPTSIARSEEVLRVLLADYRNSWILQSDGAWLRREALEPDVAGGSSFAEFKQLAINAAAAATAEAAAIAEATV